MSVFIHHAVGPDGRCYFPDTYIGSPEHDAHTPLVCFSCGTSVYIRRIDGRCDHFVHNDGEHCNPVTRLHDAGIATIVDSLRAAKEAGRPYLLRHPGLDHEIDLAALMLSQHQELEVTGPDGQPYRGDVVVLTAEGPMLIELWVSHACPRAKRRSGLKIIEIRMRTEKDAQRLSEGILAPDSEVGLHGFKAWSLLPGGTRFTTGADRPEIPAAEADWEDQLEQDCREVRATGEETRTRQVPADPDADHHSIDILSKDRVTVGVFKDGQVLVVPGAVPEMAEDAECVDTQISENGMTTWSMLVWSVTDIELSPGNLPATTRVASCFGCVHLDVKPIASKPHQPLRCTARKDRMGQDQGRTCGQIKRFRSMDQVTLRLKQQADRFEPAA